LQKVRSFIVKMSNLQERYQQDIREKLQKEFGLDNLLAVPKVKKVVISMGLGEATQDKKIIEKAAEDLTAITGQKPKVTKARQSISTFKLRKGEPIGLMVNLRGKRMYNFLEKLFRIVLPRLRDFKGLSKKGFDGRGNYSLGIKEQIVFPEVDYAKIDKIRGLEVTIVTNSKDNQQAERLLAELGMPFEEEKNV
jgi:large subunit ribosomal protein L5